MCVHMDVYVYIHTCPHRLLTNNTKSYAYAKQVGPTPVASTASATPAGQAQVNK